ncbi:proline/glycine betaine transporter-like protein [Legionella moravica]|uniref:Proline/glycine betaine transporter n=1 Tax=Legionella moravica TaxID=39962 RepID=A0A378JTN1_9GAMM|nr:MFS transporter [Legionella moravica]KTD35368.1 proline/glycine betaine transporter-like protein [Legionella moravica]STX61974.1 proline/glycine betaine transporter [Legionella moravica]
MNRKALLVVIALVFLEWLDFSLYLYLAKSVFAKLFFPPSEYSLMLSFALFATAFLARPLGGWLFGRSADGFGRRTPLIFSAALMGMATIGIALLPGYEVIGISATWGLLLLRIAQGLALGGEINNSAMFLVEHQSNKPLIAGSFVAASGAAGMFLGGATAALVQSTPGTGLWRIIFVLVGLISLWVCGLRKKLTESPEFVADRSPISQIIREEWPGIMNITIMGAFVSVTVYICNAFWVSYATDQGLGSPVACAWAGSMAQLMSALLALPIARYTPPSKVLWLLRNSMIAAFFGAPVLFWFTAQDSVAGVMLGLVLYILANGFLCSALYYFLYLQLPAQYRCRGVSTVWAISASLGAISLPVAEQAHLHDMTWIAPVWVSFIALMSYLFLSRGRLNQQDRVPYLKR